MINWLAKFAEFLSAVAAIFLVGVLIRGIEEAFRWRKWWWNK